jgi:hypothetical protein
MTRLLPITLLLWLAIFALLGAVAYVTLPPFLGAVPRLVVGGIVALAVWRMAKGIGKMD